VEQLSLAKEAALQQAVQTDTLCAMQQQELQKLHRACEDKSQQVECLTFDIKIVRSQQ
jgi:hypothetical protein